MGKKHKTNKSNPQEVIDKLEAKRDGGEELTEDEQKELETAKNKLEIEALQTLPEREKRNRTEEEQKRLDELLSMIPEPTADQPTEAEESEQEATEGEAEQTAENEQSNPEAPDQEKNAEEKPKAKTDKKQEETIDEKIERLSSIEKPTAIQQHELKAAIATKKIDELEAERKALPDSKSRTAEEKATARSLNTNIKKAKADKLEAERHIAELKAKAKGREQIQKLKEEIRKREGADLLANLRAKEIKTENQLKDYFRRAEAYTALFEQLEKKFNIATEDALFEALDNPLNLHTKLFTKLGEEFQIFDEEALFKTLSDFTKSKSEEQKSN